MSFDIYGGRLEPGHCEVHPWVAEEYPCSECDRERQHEEEMVAPYEAWLREQEEHDPEEAPEMPEIVTLCGSTRFPLVFVNENRRLTLEGRIVISVGMFGHAEGLDLGTDEEPSEVKRMLDELHLRKIDLSDRVHVLNVGGRIGHSTANEIAYAERTGKRVTYLEELL